MTLRAYVDFSPTHEATDGTGWHLTWFDDVDPAQIAAPNEAYFYRFASPNAVAATITNRALTSNVVTLTTAAPHGMVAGQHATVALTAPDPIFDGTYVLASASGSTLTYAKTNPNVTTAAAAGSVTSEMGLVEKMKQVFAAAADITAYFANAAQAALIAANAGPLAASLSSSLTGEGLLP